MPKYIITKLITSLQHFVIVAPNIQEAEHCCKIEANVQAKGPDNKTVDVKIIGQLNDDDSVKWLRRF